MRCRFCQKEFIPNKYRPTQTVCLQAECQKFRQIENLRAWRLKNPDYFKCLNQDSAWRSSRHRYTRLWKEAHKEDTIQYEKDHQKQHQQYMREYMRKYRHKNKENLVNRDKS